MAQNADEFLDAAEAHHLAGRLAEAAEEYQRALKLRPDDDQCLFLLGLVVFQLGRGADAAALIRRAVAINSAVAEYHCDLGRILFQLGDVSGSIAASRNALDLRPDFPEALFNLGNALCRSELFEEGIEAYRRAIALRGEIPDALNNIAMALLSLGRIDEAIAVFDQILAANPGDAAVHSNRIYGLHFDPASDAAAIRRELVRWNELHAKPLRSSISPQVSSRDPDRPLRIGYVSPDFREHVVGWNMLPLLQAHDRERFQIFCYSAVQRPDAMTRRLQSSVSRWREIGGISDEEAARMVRLDQIDILVDLSVHTGGNRLLLFARKPAPVQVTYLGYPGSTGLSTMDYRLSDPYIDSDSELADHTERTTRLPHSYWCYRPGGVAPDLAPPPASLTGTITFGCLNVFQKVSVPALELWSKILLAVPSSRLILHAPSGNCRAKVLELLNRNGGSADRIEFVGRLPWDAYIRSYQKIDIALDPFPYCGGITTCDALWMGVPVITLRGKTGVGRGGASILANLNLHQFVANSPEEYLAAATALAGDLTAISQLRKSLRDRMLKSHLMNSQQFARELESAYRQMWKQWAKFA